MTQSGAGRRHRTVGFRGAALLHRRHGRTHGGVAEAMRSSLAKGRINGWGRRRGRTCKDCSVRGSVSLAPMLNACRRVDGN